MTPFHLACKAKFDAGAKEHRQPWDTDHIDHLKEIQDELTDLYNYASLNPSDPLMARVMQVAEELWVEVDRRK
jgi:hypothetical protein